MQGVIPEFGEKVSGQDYIDRPGAYAVIPNAKGEIAIMKVGDSYWLPGGGIDAGETVVDAMVREAQEEMGYIVEIVRSLGKANQYLYGKPAKIYQRKCGTFFEVKIIGGDGMGAEHGHELVWLTPTDALPKLFESQAWAVQQYINHKNDPH
jgi:8-oxo-dGTP diphosphatase